MRNNDYIVNHEYDPIIFLSVSNPLWWFCKCLDSLMYCTLIFKKSAFTSYLMFVSVCKYMLLSKYFEGGFHSEIQKQWKITSDIGRSIIFL